MRVLIAPDKFKGSLGAPDVARALAAGVRRARPTAQVTALPLADGGDGTIAALTASAGGRTERVRVGGPLGDPVHAPVGYLRDGRAVVEMAAASGLALVDEGERDALRASSRGTGEAIAAVLASSAPGAPILVGLGGSASTDGGTGAATAVGWRFLDRRGRALSPGGGALAGLAAIDGAGVDPRVGHHSITGATDVDNPLLGPTGAAHVFAPQKGASPDDVERLEEGLGVLAARIARDLGMDVAERWGTGACGGTGAGLVAFFGARLVPGFDVVAELAGLEPALAAADLVITGEGRLDDQSLRGKTPVGVARAARRARVRCVVVAGEIALDPDAVAREGFARALSLVELVGRPRALKDPEAALADAAELLLGDETDMSGDTP